MNIVFLGLTITSSWGNGQASTYRALMKAAFERGHRLTFLECDQAIFRGHRDLTEQPEWGTIYLYDDLNDLRKDHELLIQRADCVVVGSGLQQGKEIAEWVQTAASGVTAFYDLQTPETLKSVAQGVCLYLNKSLAIRFDLYLSFAGGKVLRELELQMQVPRARALACTVDPAQNYPEEAECKWDLGFLGTHFNDRQEALQSLLLAPARSWKDGWFAVVGTMYPNVQEWSGNVFHLPHLPPPLHRKFYNQQRYTLNITRRCMLGLGWSPSVRFFEAAACGVPIITDYWEGLDSYFKIGTEILVANDSEDVLRILKDVDEGKRRAIAGAARNRVRREHEAQTRIARLESYIDEVRKPRQNDTAMHQPEPAVKRETSRPIDTYSVDLSIQNRSRKTMRVI